MTDNRLVTAEGSDNLQAGVAPLARPTVKLHHFYYLLAAFNVITISVCLYINHTILHTYQSSVEANQTWMARSSEYSRLRDLVAIVDSPGHDVFESNDPQAERGRMQYGVAVVNRRIQELESELKTAHDPQAAIVLADLEDVATEIRSLSAEEEIVFNYVARHELRLASSRKESLLRHANKVILTISQVREDAANIQNATLRQQMAMALSLQRSEWLITGLIILMVVATTLYGRILFQREQVVFRERAQLYQAIERELRERQHAQRELERAHEQLELEVERRTAELVSSNRELRAEMLERRRAEEALRLSDERHRDLFENATDVIFTLDMEGKFTALNRAGRDLLAIEDGTAPSKLADAVADGQQEVVRSMVELTPAAPRTRARQIMILNREKHPEKFEVSTRLILKDGQAAGVQGVARNLTERERLEGQLRQAQKMEAVGRLAGGIAHDFNNLLNVITGYSELIVADKTAHAEIQEQAQEINKTAKRAASLTRQLLAFSRKQVVNLSVLNVNTIVADAGKMLRRLIESNIDIITHLDPSLGNVKADSGQMEQLILNLALNARDAMPQGGKLIIYTRNFDWLEGAPHAKPDLAPGRYVLLEISDTGLGMSKEIQAKMFDPFFTTKELGKGTGLGLSIVYSIVKQSGGQINIYSEPGRGTTCRIYLPRVIAQQEKPQPETILHPLPKHTQTILLVEDEESLRKMTCTYLQMLGFKVLEAPNGSEALAISNRHSGPIQLVMTDVMMPKMNGFELVKQMQRNRAESKVLFMSGYADEVIDDNPEMQEESAFIQKPFSLGDLSQKLREVLS